MMNRLKYAGKGMIVDCDTRNIVSPRTVVEAYNRLACVLRDTNALARSPRKRGGPNHARLHLNHLGGNNLPQVKPTTNRRKS